MPYPVSLALLLLAAPVAAQVIVPPKAVVPPAAIVGTASSTGHAILVSCTMTSNANCTINGTGITPARKQLGNFATGCTGGVTTPGGVPDGQLYSTAAIATTFSGVGGCPTQGSPTTTATGTGIAAVDNGQNAGGTDSATVIVDIYGTTTNDSFCTADTHANDPSWIVGINYPGCTASASSEFDQTVVAGHPNVSMLWPTNWASNATTLDTATGYIDSFYWKIPIGAVPRNFETDTNLNSSPTAYGASQGAYYGWGADYSFTDTMYRVCPQGCGAWTDVEFHNGGTTLTTFAITLGDVYHTVFYGHRGIGAGYNNFCYDAMDVYDVTAGQAPTHYTLTDGSNNPLCYTPINHSSWASGPDTQAQFDQTSAGTSTVYIVSRTTIFYQ